MKLSIPPLFLLALLMTFGCSEDSDKSNSKPAYMIVDLQTGETTTASSLDLGDEYKTTKLALKRFEPGTFTIENYLGMRTPVKLTEGYYMSVFEITRQQYDLVSTWSPGTTGDPRTPIDGLSWNVIMGSGGFCDDFETVTGIACQLPTNAQWVRACGEQEGNVTPILFFDNQPIVGSYDPSPHGIYDLYGSRWEWCLDGIEFSYPEEQVVDPEFGVPATGQHAVRCDDYITKKHAIPTATSVPNGTYDVPLAFRIVIMD